MNRDDRAQLYTLEGLAAVLIMIGLLIYILQSVSVGTPQTESTIDLKLQQKTIDTLNCLDVYDEFGRNILKDAIIGWGGGESRSGGPVLDWGDAAARATLRYPVTDLPCDPADLPYYDPADPLYNPADPTAATRYDKMIKELDHDISIYYTHSDVTYNLDICYYDCAVTDTKTPPKVVSLIKHGEPYDNSVTAKKLITINDGDIDALDITSPSFWKITYKNNNQRGGLSPYPLVVEVRLTAWYL